MSRSYIIHTPDEIRRIRRAAAASAWLRDKVAEVARPGMSTWELDQAAGALIRETGGKSAFLNYCGYPGNICISLNDEVVHGIGVPERIIRDNDLVSIDVGVAIDGAVGDTALTFTFAPLTPEKKNLMEGTREALAAGIKAARRGNTVSHISRAVEEVAKHRRLGVVADYTGHGCGIKLHEPPEVPNFTGWGRGATLVPGMVICIEPMFNAGDWRVTLDRGNHWTVRTRDGSPSAHFEHQILITDNEPEILTWQKTT